MPSLAWLLRRNQQKAKPLPTTAVPGPSSAGQGPLLRAGQANVKDSSFNSSWKTAWVELRESDSYSPILQFYTHDTPLRRELIAWVEVCNVRRIHTKRCTLRVDSKNNRRHFYLQFSTDIELYDWLEEVYLRCPGTGVVDYQTFSHDLSIREPNEAGNITGFPRALAEFVDLYSIRSSIGSTSSTAAPDFGHSEPGLSSGETAPVITPKSTLPGAAVDIASVDDSVNSLYIPRVDLPDDHIGFAPGPRTPPTVFVVQTPVLPSVPSNFNQPPSPGGAAVLDVQSASHPGKSSVLHVRDLTRGIKHISRYPVASGGFSDVYRARLAEGHDMLPVGIKVIRDPLSSPAVSKKIAKRLKAEINVWHNLDHPNVVHLLGICRGLGPRPALVSMWHENGHVMRYLEDLGDRATLLLKLKLILDIAMGLSYLHSFSTPVLHCDLKAANVLVSSDGVACLTDFGLSSLFENLTSSKCLSDSGALDGSVRWMAIELVCSLGQQDDGFIRFTPATDVYSFGSTMLEILSGKVPYHTKRLDAQVIMDIYNGARHRREDMHISLMHWQLMERCWADIPEERPDCTTIVKELETYYWHEQYADIEHKMRNTASAPDSRQLAIRTTDIGIAV